LDSVLRTILNLQLTLFSVFAIGFINLQNFTKLFFNVYLIKNSFLQACRAEYQKVYQMIPELPFGNIWVAQHMVDRLPTNSYLQLGILNSLRSWNFFELPPDIESGCNVGGFGIDGTLSTVIGRSLLHPKQLHFCVLGDLSFFYDLNSLGNRHVLNNIRILLINNGMGAEFRNYGHPAYFLGDIATPFIAAAGHYGNKSDSLVKNYSETLGYKYLSAKNKEEFMESIEVFVNPKITTSMVFELFVEPENEDIALESMLNLLPNFSNKTSLSKKVKRQIKEVIGEEKITAIKTLLKL